MEGPPPKRPLGRFGDGQGVEGSGIPGPGETLGSPWPPLAIRPWAVPRVSLELDLNGYRLQHYRVFMIIVVKKKNCKENPPIT
jgi:hypothetical protein